LFVIAALVLGSVVRVLVAFYIARFQFGVFAIAFNIGFWRKLLLAALPIGLIAIFSQFNAQIDKQIVLLANYKPALGLNGETAAGVYGFAYKIFELAIVLPSFIMNVGYPIMVQKKEEGLTSLFNFAKKLAAVLLALGFFCLILGWFLVPFIFKVPGLEKFSVSVATTRILLLGFPLFFITPATLWLAVTLNKTREMMFIYGFAALFNLVANLVFVPSFGYNAAAVITIASELLILALSLGVLFFAFKGRET
jgi:O-antigen/teichoic acid export membrane protein